MLGSIGKSKAATVLLEGLNGWRVDGDAAADLALGATLRSYKFDRYKTRKGEGDDETGAVSLTIACRDYAAARRAAKSTLAIAEGVAVARDLVNEPPNVLYPEEFARRAEALSKLGVEIEVLDEKKLEKIGMRALLAVGQGSAEGEPGGDHALERRQVGAKGEKAKPVAFIGKGVTLRYRRHFHQARPGHGGHEGRHGGRRLRRRAYARAGLAQGEGERDRRDWRRREHAGRQRPAAGRHRDQPVRSDHRDHQHRRRGPSRAVGRALVRAGQSTSRPSWWTSPR